MSKTIVVLSSVFVLLTAISSFGNQQLQQANSIAAETASAGKTTFGNWGVETKNISKTIQPGDDFFTFVNEGWIKSTKIPEGSSEFGAFDPLYRKTEQRVNAIIHDTSKAIVSTGDPSQQIRDLYASFMNSDHIEELGLSPIQGELSQILAIRTHEDVARWMADPRSSSLVAINVFPDAGDTKRWLVHLDQNNLAQPILGLPNRDDYQRKDGSAPGNRTAYVAYVTETLQRAGIDNAAKRAADIMVLETKLAARQWNLEQLRDRKAHYHLMTRRGLATYAPGFPWNAFLVTRQVGDVKEVVLGTDTAVKAQAEVFAETPVDVWASYLAFHFLQNQVELLPSAFVSASWEFYQKRLSGYKEPRAREVSAIEFVSRKRDDLVGNVQRLRKAQWVNARTQLNKADRNLAWYQTPQTVDASFSSLLNAIELPAALLQPPFFDPYADPAVNFGSIAAIIGHEMGHGFDDQGANFDGQGRIRNWWSDYSRQHFKERTETLVEQYSAFSPLEGFYVNGKQTLGENIGDLTGVSIAYRAYHLYLRDHHSAALVLDGYSGDQRFFLAWGQTWRYIATDGAMRYILSSGYHSPAMYRVNGVVRNIDAWYAAFGVTANQKLYLPPKARVNLW